MRSTSSFLLAFMLFPCACSEHDSGTDTGQATGASTTTGNDTGDETTSTTSGESTTETSDTGSSETGGEPAQMVMVPAGIFGMGCNTSTDVECAFDELPAHDVELDAFEIDRHEVTVARYRGCVDAGSCTEPDTELGCNWGEADRDPHPVNCVDWTQAEAFCGWDGKRLPTEAEWEKASRGTDGRLFPWGDEAATCAHAVMVDEGSTPGCGTSSTWEVGSRPDGASAHDVMDMAGNVSEWVADWYLESYYNESPATNPTGPATGMDRVVRGGSWEHGGSPQRCSARGLHLPPDARTTITGIRCAR